MTREPELRYIPSGTAVCNFSIAMDKGLSKEKKAEMESKGQSTADFLNVVTWGKVAENSATYLAKGRLVAVQGSIQSGWYEDKDGKKVYTTDLNARNVEFLEWEKNNTSAGNSQGFQPTDGDIPF